VEAVLQSAPRLNDMTLSNNTIYVLTNIGLTAGYWEDGTLTLINDVASYQTEADAFAVQGTDVYIAGIVTAINNQRNPVYWKNGNIVRLPTAKTSVGGGQNVISGIKVVVYPAN